MSATSLQAPVGGIQTLVSFDDMKPEEAIYLVNWFPEYGSVRMRLGSLTVSDTGGADIGTLMNYDSPTGEKLLCAVDDKIQDITDFAAPVDLGGGFSESRWFTAQFNRIALFMNGIDLAQQYDDNTLSAIAFTGSVTPSALIGCLVFKGRAYYWQKDELRFHYAAAGAYAGNTSAFDLSIVSRRGGNVVHLFAVSADAGDGLDDFFCVLLSSGELIVYAGDDPADVATWSLVGRYQMGQPISTRGAINYGSDVIVLTSAGWESVKQIIRFGQTQDTAFSRNIERFAKQAVDQYRTNEYWQVIFYPAGPYVLINIPEIDKASYVQHVVNTNTGAWTTYRGWVSNCYAIFNEALYFGGPDGKVRQAEIGRSDDGDEIITDALPAYSYLSGRANKKQMTGVRVITSSSLPGNIVVNGTADFDVPSAEAPPPSLRTGSSTPWGSPWGSPWEAAVDPEVQGEWQSINEEGYALSYRMNLGSNFETIQWFSTQIMYKDGGVI